MQASDTRITINEDSREVIQEESDTYASEMIDSLGIGSESTFDGYRYVSPRTITGRKVA